jgi:hypothetical protein
MRMKPVEIRTYKEQGMNNKRDTDIRNRVQVLFCEEGAGGGGGEAASHQYLYI